MKRVTVSVEEEHVETIDDFQEANDLDSRSEAVRRLLDAYEDLQTDYEDLHTQYEELQTDVERLRNEKRLILEDREEKQELVEYVEEERTVEQRWREAGLTTRLRWKLFGMDSTDDDDD